jgi:hypothetical protein
LGKSFLHIGRDLGGIWAGIGKICKEDLGNLKKNIDQSQAMLSVIYLFKSIIYVL